MSHHVDLDGSVANINYREQTGILTHNYAGKNFTDRQRIKRKAANWGKRYQALLMLFEVLMVVFMEKRTTKDSRNSSKLKWTPLSRH